MNDLFGPKVCECCGQPLPDQSVTETTKDGSFAKFWASIPRKGVTKGSKKNAEKAWHKLTPQEQALAVERAPVFYTLTSEERFGALGLHVSTFLNGGHYEEEVIVEKMKRRQEKAAYDPRQMAANNIKSGKRFLCTNIPSTKARYLIEIGLVTEDECRKVGVL